MKLFSRMDPSLRRLYGYFWPYKGTLLLACLFLIGSASTSSITATLLGKITDAGFYNQAAWVIWAAPTALIGVTVGFAVCTVVSSFLMAKVSQSVLKTIRVAMFERFLRWPSQAYQDNTTGLVSSKFVNEAGIALGGAANAVIILVRDSLQVLGLLGVLFWHNWQLTLVTFVALPGLIFIFRRIAKRVRRIVKESQETVASMISRVEESYDAERIVKISGTYDFEDRRFAKVNERIAKLAVKTTKLESLSTPVSQVMTMLAVAFVVAVALLEAQKGLLSIGEFITFLTALLMLKAPVRHLSSLNGTFASISAAAESIFTVLDIECENDKGTQTLEKARGQLVFEDVTLRYPTSDKDALKGLNLTIHPGEYVALVGASGSGKTTVINMIPRFWEATSGRILLDGVDVKELTLASLRDQISIVTQDPVLFDASLRDNIAYGYPNATEEDLWRVVDAAGLSSFVRSHEKGLDMPVGDEGGLLSGGQRQRVAIARALLKDAPILIFDEATSALDSETEHHIKEALEALRQGRTCITVAHRFSSIEHVDRIIVMRDGRIVESGTWDELMASDGEFAQLSRLQGITN